MGVRWVVEGWEGEVEGGGRGEIADGVHSEHGITMKWNGHDEVSPCSCEIEHEIRKLHLPRNCIVRFPNRCIFP